jgi:ubiquinone/menaquinone biosynthesis C-methylase UbiE
MRLILAILRPLYYLLYHQFAWAYDLVAAVVSLGRWKRWVLTGLPYLHGRVLEIGYGPGHLQLALQQQGIQPFGVDESRQMARQASRRIRKAGGIPRLLRGYAQSLPFPANTFDTVVSTFPSEYIFDPQTLTEIHRLLVPGGMLVIVPMAWVTGTRPLERLMAWLFRVTGEAPGMAGPISSAMSARFTRAGFRVRSELVESPGSQVLMVIAQKSG